MAQALQQATSAPQWPAATPAAPVAPSQEQLRQAPAPEVASREVQQLTSIEEAVDYRTYFCVIAALVQKPSRDIPLKQGRKQSPEIDIPSW